MFFPGEDAEITVELACEPGVGGEEVFTGAANGDGVVNILDLVKISSFFGQTINPDDLPEGCNPDINGDGIVNILDLVAASGNFGGGTNPPAAPSQFVRTVDVPVEVTVLERNGSATTLALQLKTNLET